MPNGNQTPPTSPLGEPDLERINQSLKQLDEAQVQADLAKRAGIDIGEEEGKIRETRQKLQRIKQVYFPGR